MPKPRLLNTYVDLRCRIFALPGTPIENHMWESFWSIFQIVLPGLFVLKKNFKSWVLRLLRDLSNLLSWDGKNEVLQELPDLIETTYHNELDESQKTIYLASIKANSRSGSKF